MPRARVGLACLLVVGVAAVSPAAVQAGGTSPMVRKINKVRHAHGLPSLHRSRSLSRSAAGFARHLMRVDVFSHASRIHASSRFSRLGEMLALNNGWRVRRSSAVRGWLRSPEHRGLMLSSSFTSVGAGLARGSFRGGPATIWVVQLGRR
jgi:uncharacterized protein YkwD